MRDGRGAPVLGAILVVAVIVVAAFLIGAPDTQVPLDPRSHRPSGTSALVALLRELGASVELDAGLPDDEVDVALVLRDRFDDVDRAHLESWVREGGVAVVVDPGSPLTPPSPGESVLDDGDGERDDPVDELGGDPGPVGLDIVVPVQPGVCDIDALDDPDTDWIDVYGGPVDYEVSGSAESCYGNGETAYVVATPTGEGTVVALGGSGILVNQTLDEADNAPIIAALLAPTEGTRVAVFDPRVPALDDTGDETLWGLVPTGVKRALAQLGIAFLVYVVWRSRRLGRPVDEPQPVKVAGSELVAAVGGLLERSKSPQHAADVLRADLRRDLRLHLGLPDKLSDEAFAQAVAGRTSLDAVRLRAALGPGPVDNDRDLLAVAQLLDHVRKEAFDHVGS